MKESKRGSEESSRSRQRTRSGNSGAALMERRGPVRLLSPRKKKKRGESMNFSGGSRKIARERVRVKR